MRSERGQATVEWVGIVLLVALALAALSHFAPRADGKDLGSALAGSVTRPAARPAPRAPAPAHTPASGAFPVPPLIPGPGASIPRVGEPIRRAGAPGEPIPRTVAPIPRASEPISRAGAPVRRAGGRAAALRVRLPRGRTLLVRARAGAGTAWRRAWIACLVYERFRYALLHPESRFPGHTIPPSEVLRMVNDCISPLDLVRDWPELTR